MKKNAHFGFIPRFDDLENMPEREELLDKNTDEKKEEKKEEFTDVSFSHVHRFSCIWRC